MTDDKGDLLFISPQNDAAAYSRLSTFLLKKGIETPVPDWLDPVLQTREPYHYVDVWLSALIQQLVEIPSVVSYGCVTISILLSLSYLLNKQILRKTYGHSITKFSIGIISFASTFIGPGIIVSQINWKYLSGISDFAISLVMQNKIIPAFLLIGFGLIWSNNIKTQVASIIAFLAVPLVHITFLPFAFVAIFVLILNLIINKLYNELKWVAVAIILFCIAMLGYSIEINYHINLTNDSIDIKQTYKPEVFNKIKTAVNIAAGSVIKIALLLMILIFIAIVGLNKIEMQKFLKLIIEKQKLNIIIIPLGMGSSILSWAIMQDHLDSVQLTTNITCVLFVLGSLISIASLFNSRIHNKYIRKIFGVIIVFLATLWMINHVNNRSSHIKNQHSVEYQKSARIFFQSHDGFGLRFRGLSSFPESSFYEISPTLSTSNVATALASNGYEIMIPLEGLKLSEDPRLLMLQKKMLIMSPLYRYTGLKLLNLNDDYTTLLTFLKRVPATHAVFEGLTEIPPVLQKYTSGCILDNKSLTLLCEWHQPE
jgi:hypothetical protein